MTFGEALENLKLGYSLQRESWNGPGQFIKLQEPNENSKMSRRYLYISTVEGRLVPWVASQTDVLAEDWRVVDTHGEPI